MTKAVEINVNWQEWVIIDTLSKAILDGKQKDYKLRNLWTKKDAGNTKQPLKATVPPHDILLLRFKK